VLFIEAEFQGLFTVRIKGKQIEIIVRAAVENAAVKINSGINESVGGATVFGLDVIEDVPDLEVGIMAKEHL
jgi:hypothetical protein